MPEPPEHRAYLVQLAELVTSTLAAEHEAAPRVFSVPGDAEMLRQGHGNIEFADTPMAKDMQRCSIARSEQKLWLASDPEIEVRGLPGRVTTEYRPERCRMVAGHLLGSACNDEWHRLSGTGHNLLL